MGIAATTGCGASQLVITKLGLIMRCSAAHCNPPVPMPQGHVAKSGVESLSTPKRDASRTSVYLEALPLFTVGDSLKISVDRFVSAFPRTRLKLGET